MRYSPLPKTYQLAMINGVRRRRILKEAAFLRAPGAACAEHFDAAASACPREAPFGCGNI